MPKNEYPREVEGALGDYSSSLRSSSGYGSRAREEEHEKKMKKLLPGSTPRLREALRRRARQRMGLE